MSGGVGLRRARELTVDCSTLARLTSHFDRSRLSPAPMQKNCAAAQASGGSDASGRRGVSEPSVAPCSRSWLPGRRPNF